ncbi:MAG: peptidoglycan DD-metalloendopeptidase family protein [Holosporales bacterium]|jgi:murein DD-endopeptidase MepM/ murein hydrolase activator NlpD|nr:peptidoglycan DD-metalloendopeptidase family protein [Holosporales bacterium]
MLALRTKQALVPLALLSTAMLISTREYYTFRHLSQFTPIELPFTETDSIEAEPDEEKIPLGSQQRSLSVACGDTLSSILKDIGVSLKDIDAITKAISKHYNLRSLQIGQPVELFWESAPSGATLTKLETIDSIGNVVTLEMLDGKYVASIRERTIVSKLQSIQGTVHSDFVTSAQQQGVPNAVIHEAVRALTPLINANRLKLSSTFEIVFEEKLDADTKKLVGKRQLKYVAVSVDGHNHKVYGFGNRYYSETGSSLKTEFLITPIRTRNARISSKFGMRLHPIFKVMKKHCGIDYEARYGTEVFAAANGVVVSAGSFGGYGLYVRIRHSNGFETAYGHLSALLVRRGDRVSQGDCIGRVGSTGHATGSHLHHEVIRNQIHVDPQKYHSIGSDKLVGEELAKFKKYKEEITRATSQARASV